MPAILSPSRWKRILYSILSVLLGAPIAFLMGFLAISLWNPRHFSIKSVLELTVVFSAFSLPLCTPGWFIALPFVLNVTDFSKWRFFTYWAIGTAMGPLVMLGFELVMFARNSHSGSFSFDAGGAWIATGVASLVTLLYLLLVRFDQSRARRREANNAEQPDPTPQTP